MPKPGEDDVLRRILALHNEGFGDGRIAREVGVEEGVLGALLRRTGRLGGPGSHRNVQGLAGQGAVRRTWLFTNS